MEIKETQHEGYVTLLPQGDLDANSSIIMDESIQGQIDEGRLNIHVDCSGLEYISSAGLGVFISHMDELKEAGGQFVFSNMSDKVFQVFKLLGLEALMTIVPDRAQVATEFT